MPVDPCWTAANPDVPDARTRRPLQEKRHRVLGWMEPVFCVNCGAPGGYVTGEWAAHIFYVCDTCESVVGSVPELQIPDALVRGGGKS